MKMVSAEMIFAEIGEDLNLNMLWQKLN